MGLGVDFSIGSCRGRIGAKAGPGGRGLSLLGPIEVYFSMSGAYMWSCVEHW